MGIAFACQNGFNDCLSGHSADVAQHIRQLDIHLRQRLLHPLDVPCCRPHEVMALPPVCPHRANLLGRPKGISTAHTCAASSAIDSPARRFCAQADSSFLAHSPSTLRNPQLQECRIPRSSTLLWTAWQRSEFRIASANRPLPSAPLWCTRSAVLVDRHASAGRLCSEIRCRYRCPRRRDASPPNGGRRSGFCAPSPAVASGSSRSNGSALNVWLPFVVWVAC